MRLIGMWTYVNLSGVEKPVVVLPAEEVALGEFLAPAHLEKFNSFLLSLEFGEQAKVKVVK